MLQRHNGTFMVTSEFPGAPSTFQLKGKTFKTTKTWYVASWRCLYMHWTDDAFADPLRAYKASDRRGSLFCSGLKGELCSSCNCFSPHGGSRHCKIKCVSAHKRSDMNAGGELQKSICRRQADTQPKWGDLFISPSLPSKWWSSANSIILSEWFLGFVGAK